MVVKKKTKEKKAKEGGMDLDDAFADDEDVSYRESKPKKVKAKADDEEEVSVQSLDESVGEKRNIKASKPIKQIKKGDKLKIDGKEYEVDAQYVLIDHGTTKEMTIELFDSKTDKDYQLRYFDDQVETTIDFYELNEILYNKKPFKKIEW
ncbi:MAG: hypothetical protein AABX07_01815 [Nanoarchaeota archaeon]